MRIAPALFLAFAAPLCAATEWLKITSPNFEMYTTAGEKEARRTLEYFEQVRDFFMRVKSQQVTTRLPVTIVAFRNEKEYKPYAPRETASAYYVGDEQRDYIVLGGVGSEQYPVAVHEYMHLLIRHSGLQLPPWLNEGFAEVYSSLTPYGGKILVGSVPNGRAHALSQYKWFPVDALLGIPQNSSHFDEKNRTSVFYSQSWLLTHMLMLGDGYAPEFAKFVSDASASGSATEALQRVYNQSPTDLDKKLQAYYRSDSLKGMLFDTKLQKIEITPGAPASDLETRLTLAKLTTLLRRTDDARSRYAELTKSYPDSWQVYEALAHSYWIEGATEKTKENFRKAVDLKPTSWKPYWDYARFAQGEEGTIDALRAALRLNPALNDARLMLGYELYRAQKYKDAYEVFATVKQVTPDRAPSFFLMKAFSALEAGEKEVAKSSAEMAKKYAKTAVEIKQAEDAIAHLTQPDRRLIPTLPAQTGTGASTLNGKLQEIECLGPEARLRISSGASVIALLIRDPDRVQLKNADSSSVTLTCGPQKGGEVTVGFKPVEDPTFKTLGDVVTLEFKN